MLPSLTEQLIKTVAAITKTIQESASAPMIPAMARLPQTWTLFNLVLAPKIFLSSLLGRSSPKFNFHLLSTGSMAGTSSKRIVLSSDTNADYAEAGIG